MSIISRFTDWVTHPMRKQVYEFHEGGLSDVSLLGNKGANLCEMCRLKIPVPPGFILTTEACVEYFHHLKEQRENRADLKEGVAQMLPAHLVDEYTKAVHDLEQRTGRTFGLAKDKAHAHDCPLLLAVRSGAAVSMPGMMDSVLNLGLNDEIIDKLARSTENIHFALDTYRRFLQMFGCVVLGVPKVEFDNILNNVKSRTGHLMDSQLEVVDLQEVITAYKAIAIVPSDPWEQLELTIAAVFNSWNNPRAVSYRDINGISNCAGTAVTIQSMVFGNMNYKSGTGVCFTRHPSTGENVFFGEYLCNAEGEELVAGCRSPHGLEYLKKTQPAVFESLSIIQKQLEFSYRDMQDIEFTVENGELFVLQTRTGKRTAQASVRIAVEMAEERLITQREALLRVDANQMDFFQHPTIDPAIAATGLCGLGNLKIGRGLPASSGASTGAIVFSSESALQWSREGRAVILCRVETSADDIVGFKACEGILTMKGGMTSHAAVVARGMGKSAVTGAGMCVTSLSNCYMHIDPELEILTCADGTMLRKGEIITIDGSQGDVYKGAVPTVPAGHDANYKVLLGWADRYKRLQVFANAETEDDVRMAVTCGAEGIGLCRTEHMFFKSDRIDLFRKMILSTSSLERNECLQSIMPMNRGDILSIFRLMKNRQVTVRLLDPPLHEFLPSTNTASFVRDVTDLALRIGMDPVVCLARVRELQESNPMLGFRGCRLSVVYPEITTMQVKAILGILEEMARAACSAHAEGFLVRPEIMIPLVCSDHEIDCIIPAIKEAAAEVFADAGFKLYYKIGCMLEVPRACIRADSIVSNPNIGFVSFGTNDLTQMMYGFSRDDSSQFMQAYKDKNIIGKDPFVTIDERGVGVLLRTAVHKCRHSNKKAMVGVCGEHGGDPSSIAFFDRLGLDYVSCSPYRVPTAKIAAAQAHIKASMSFSDMSDDLLDRLALGLF